ncbi:MAG TPA: DUF308 domain-containing protein [Gemmatimonadales bacterium]|nr:DUF308 domain-containing protein [Gemmatimonadales bacterium]
MTTDLIELAYRRTWRGLVLRGLLGLALGLFILWRPLASIAVFALVIAIWALFSGIVQIVHAFDLRGAYAHWWVQLLGGLVSVLFGAAALYYYPALSLAFVVVWIALWLILSGVFAIYLAMLERGLHLSAWGWTFAFGLLACIAGLIALLSPGITVAAIVGLIAAFAIVSGVVLLIGAYRLSSARHDLAGSARSARAGF